MMTSIFTTRVIPHDEAREIAQRLINSFFRQEPGARVGIPARPDHDDDLLIVAYINQQDATGDEIARLKRREAELLEANNRYLQRARDAESGIKRRDDQIFHLLGISHNEATDLRRGLADADAATVAMEAKVVDLEQTIARAHKLLDDCPELTPLTSADVEGAVFRAWEELGGEAGPKRGG